MLCNVYTFYEYVVYSPNLFSANQTFDMFKVFSISQYPVQIESVF
jgi:hypothetical protein